MDLNESVVVVAGASGAPVDVYGRVDGPVNATGVMAFLPIGSHPDKDL